METVIENTGTYIFEALQVEVAFGTIARDKTLYMKHWALISAEEALLELC